MTFDDVFDCILLLTTCGFEAFALLAEDQCPVLPHWKAYACENLLLVISGQAMGNNNGNPPINKHY